MNNPTIIVSGLPRSGTSMMMKMLEAGGLEVLTDNIRRADEDNPRGYYEFEKVKQLKDDAGWLDEAGGKVVKMVSKLLQDLPADRPYKVIFMRRHLDEVIRSQNRMLERKGSGRAAEDPAVIRRLFEKHLAHMEAWIAVQAHLDCLYVSYNEMLQDPAQKIGEITGFLDAGLNTQKMLRVIDSSLYRQQAGK